MVTQSSANIKTAAAGKVLQGQGVGTANDFSTATYPSTATSTGTILRADGTNWSATTATYPNTTTANQILYSSSGNVIGEITTGNNKLLTTNGSGVPSLTNAFITTTAWTPNLQFGGANVGITYTVQNGYYVRMGDIVFCGIYIQLSSKGSSTGVATISNLPVATGGTSYFTWNTPLAQFSMTLGAGYTVVFLNFANTSTVATIYESGSGKTPTTLTDASYSGSDYMVGGFFYSAV